MKMMWPCEVSKESENSEALNIVSNNVSSIAWAIESALKWKIEEQEKAMVAFIKKLWWYDNIKDMAKCTLEIKWKIEVKKIEKQKQEIDEEEWEIDLDIFTDLNIKDNDDKNDS